VIIIAMLLYSVFVILAVSWMPSACQAGKFWHISDLHLDYQYSVDGNATNLCHKSNTSSPESSSSSINNVLGPAGDYRCDSPKVLVKSILQAMKRLEPYPDFIVWTGDNGAHVYNPTPSLSEIVATQSMVFKELDSLFPNIPVIASLGNHDSDPPDSYPLQNATAAVEDDNTTASQYYEYYHQGGFNKQLINDDQARETFLKCGYYFRTIQDSKGLKMRFLVLNTNVYYYNQAKVNGSDPCGQMAWMNQTFSSLAQQEKVFIVAHVPPGSFERNPGISFFNYNNTVNDVKFGPLLEKKYVSLVVDPEVYEHIHAHLYGHAHTDSFRLFLSRTGDDHVRGVGFLASSGTPMIGHGEGTNPGMRLYTYDDMDGTLLDYQQFGLDLKKLKLDNVTQKSTAPDGDTGASRERRELFDTTTIIPPTTESNEETTISSIENANLNINPTIKPQLNESQVNQTLGNMGENPTEPKTRALLGHKGENPMEPKTETLFGHIGENPTEPKTQTLLRHMGENPTVQKNQPLIGHMGENPIVQKNQPILGHKGENPTESQNPTILGHKGENPTGTALEPSKDTNNNATKNVDDEEMQKLIDAISSKFNLIYRATDAYGVHNLTAAEMGYAFNQMSKNSKVFNFYYIHNTNNHVNGNGRCDEVCYRDHMCTIKYQVTEDLNRCRRQTSESLLVDISLESVVHKAAINVTVEATTVTPVTNPSTASIQTTAEPTTTAPAEKSYKPIIPLSTTAPRPTTVTPSQTTASSEDEITDEAEPYMPASSGDAGVEKKASSNSSSQIAGIILGAAGAILVFVVFGIAMRKYRQRRYRDQEFLLTDSVFRYDGYNQLDDGF
jgi:sphingomyelin phosphodiesterase acid-like 3